MVEKDTLKWHHLETPKDKSKVTSHKSSCSLSDWGSSTATNKLNEKVTRAELLFSGFIAVHNLSIATADHSGSLFREIFPDSKTAAKYKCKRTKTTHVLTGAVTKDNAEEIPKYLQSSWYGIATDRSIDETDKYLSVLVRYEVPHGLIQTSLLDMPDINVGSDAQTTFNTIDYAIKSAKLSWDYCIPVDTGRKLNVHQTFGIHPGRLLNVLCTFNLRPVSTGMTYSADSTNSMVGKKNSLLTKVKNAQQKGQSIFDVGYPFNLASLCAEKGAKELSLNLEDMITDIYYHFRRSVKRKSILREYMEFTNTHIRKFIKHVSTRWLILGKCLGRRQLSGMHWSLTLYQTLIWVMMHAMMKKMII